MNLARQLLAIHFRHVHVEHAHVEAVIALQQVQRLARRCGFDRDHAPAGCQLGEDAAIRRVVVHDQEAAILQVRQIHIRLLRRARLRFGQHRKLKRRPLSRLAFRPHAAAQ